MAPPGPIPNPEVKHRHVDGSRTTGPARVDSCQDQTTPVGAIRRGLTVIRGGPCILLPSRWLIRRRPSPPHPFGANTACLSSLPYSRRQPCLGARPTGAHPSATAPGQWLVAFTACWRSPPRRPAKFACLMILHTHSCAAFCLSQIGGGALSFLPRKALAA